MNVLICTYPAYLTTMLKLRSSHLWALPLMQLNNSGLHVPGITISLCPQKCSECYSLLNNPHSALSYPVIFTHKFFFFLHDTVLPSVTSPSCLQTTAASIVSQLSLQTVPHCPPIQTSTLPSCSSPPPVSLMSVSLQDGPKRHTFRNASHMAQTSLSFILPWAYMQCTKQLRMVAEATSFQLTCKIIASFAAVGWALEKTTPKNCGKQIAIGKKIMNFSGSSKWGWAYLSHVMLFQYSPHMQLELAISNYSVT